jgi:hypothetical protein
MKSIRDKLGVPIYSLYKTIELYNRRGSFWVLLFDDRALNTRSRDYLYDRIKHKGFKI